MKKKKTLWDEFKQDLKKDVEITKAYVSDREKYHDMMERKYQKQLGKSVSYVANSLPPPVYPTHKPKPVLEADIYVSNTPPPPVYPTYKPKPVLEADIVSPGTDNVRQMDVSTPQRDIYQELTRMDEITPIKNGQNITVIHNHIHNHQSPPIIVSNNNNNNNNNNNDDFGCGALVFIIIVIMLACMASTCGS